MRAIRDTVGTSLSILAVSLLLNASVSAQPEPYQIFDAPVGGEIVGCPPYLTAMHTITNTHDELNVTTIFQGGSAVGSLLSGCHNHKEGYEGDPEPTVERCFEAGVDSLPGTTMVLVAEIAGVTHIVAVEGPIKIRRYGDVADPGPATIELDEMVMTGQTDTGYAVTLRIGASLGLPPSMGTVERATSSQDPSIDIGRVQALVNAEILLEGTVGVSDVIRPGMFLAQNRPNPFRQATEILFALADRSGPVSLDIYGASGGVVRTLITEPSLEAGEHRVSWDGRNADGEPVASGSYYYKLRVGDREVRRKLSILR